MTPPLRTFAEWIRHWAVERPNAPAWGSVQGEEVLWYSWSQVGSWIDFMVEFLQNQRVASGDRIVTILPNSAAWIAIDAACSEIGAIHVPLPPNGTNAWIESAIDQVVPIMVVTSEHSLGEPGPQRLHNKRQPVVTVHPEPGRPAQEPALDPFTSSNHAREVLPLANVVDADQTFNILFTSGTSGTPKGVMLSHRNLMLNAEAKLDAMPQYESDLRLNLLPFTHAYARTCEVSTWAISGSRMICSGGLQQFWKLAPKVQPTLINAVPYFYHTLYSDIVRERSLDSRSSDPLDQRSQVRAALESRLGSNIRMLASGGAALPPKLFDFFQQAGYPIYQGYGLTEASPVVCSNRWGQSRIGTVGPTVKGVQIRIDDDGILWVKGPTVMKGYWQNPEATRERMIDGWLNTNDLAEIDDQGTLRIFGRSDDVIVLSTGRKVAPLPIETALLQCEGVRAAIVLGENQPYLTAIIYSSDWVTMNDSMRLEMIDKALHSFASYMRPKRCIVVDSVPSKHPDLFNAKGSPKRKVFEQQFCT